MMLDAKQRVRHARHRSLVELGEEGVLALLRADTGSSLSDERAESVRVDYLSRAGLATTSPSLERTTTIDVAAFATVPYLEEAAAACLGALHAVARIRVAAAIDSVPSIPEFQLRDDAPADGR